MMSQRRDASQHQHVQRGRDAGASLVEFALLVPILTMLLLGTITGGITISRDNSVKNAVREGTRFGAVNPLGDPVDIDAYLAQVIQQAENGATGDLDDGVEGKRICAAFIDGTGTITQREKTNSGTTTSSSRCFDDGRSDERIQVEAERRSEIEAILYTGNVTLSSRSVTRYER